MTKLIAGVDEAGRGPLVGKVVAAAVILNPNDPIVGLRDSKQLTAKARERLAADIKARALAFAISEASVEEIDTLNILAATMLAMKRAVLALNLAPDVVMIDGNRAPILPYATETVIKGDQKIAAISAASILAKTTRDAQMAELHERYPEYDFIRHKGYGTAAHLAALDRYGACPEHRKTFAPVARVGATCGRPP